MPCVDETRGDVLEIVSMGGTSCDKGTTTYRTSCHQEHGKVRNSLLLHDIDADKNDHSNQRQQKRERQVEGPLSEVIAAPGGRKQNCNTNTVGGNSPQVGLDLAEAQSSNNLGQEVRGSGKCTSVSEADQGVGVHLPASELGDGLLKVELLVDFHGAVAEHASAGYGLFGFGKPAAGCGGGRKPPESDGTNDNGEASFDCGWVRNGLIIKTREVLTQEEPLPSLDVRLDLEDAEGEQATERSSNDGGTEVERNSKGKLVSLVEETEIKNSASKEASLHSTKSLVSRCQTRKDGFAYPMSSLRTSMPAKFLATA